MLGTATSRIALTLVAASVALTARSSVSGKTATASSAPADTAAAQTLLSPFTGKPSAFPVDAPLKTKPTSGSTFAYLPVWIPDLFNGVALIIAVGLAKFQGGGGRMRAISRALQRGSATGPDPVSPAAG